MTMHPNRGVQMQRAETYDDDVRATSRLHGMQSPYPHAVQPVVDDGPAGFSRSYLQDLMDRVIKALEATSQYYIDTTNRVDEYRAQGLEVGGESLTTEALQPDYECDEIITGVIVTGTPAGTFTLQLGKRVWNLIMPASGILVIAPIQIKLGRSDNRQLIATVAGDWSFELTGFAETGRRGRV